MTMKRSLPPDVPVTSPYYDRLRSLNMQLGFVPYGSPEYRFLSGEIDKLERRAADRMEAYGRIGVKI